MGRFVVAALLAVVGQLLTAGASSALPDQRCGSANGWDTGVVGAASCGLALNVASHTDPSFVSSAFNIRAFSPTTGLSYDLVCHDATAMSGQSRAYECGVMTQIGGIVYLWHN